MNAIAHPHTRRVLKIVAVVVALVLLLVLGFAFFVLRTERGAVFALNRAVAQLDGKLSYERAAGTLPGPLTVENLRYADPAGGIDVAVQRATIDLALGPLLDRTVRIESLAADGVSVAVTTVDSPEDPNADPWQPPVPLVIDAATVTNARVTQDREPLVDARRLDLAAAWTTEAIDVTKLVLDATQGRVELAGRVAATGNHEGKANANFRWTVGTRTFAGTGAFAGDGRTIAIDANLAEPTALSARIAIEPTETLPWRGEVTVPSFDLARVVPDSTFGNVGAQLSGSGTRDSVDVTGLVTLREQGFAIEAAKLALSDGMVVLEPLHVAVQPSSDPAVVARGRIEAVGSIEYGKEPIEGDLQLTWRDVLLPPDLLGQAIASEGTAGVSGSAEDFGVDGQFSVGPPGQPASIELDLSGDTEALRFEQLDVVQAQGRLSAAGTVTLPQDTGAETANTASVETRPLGWAFHANAERFDPGAFFATWPGSLSFTLETEGTMTPDGARGDFRLADLTGTLRQRPIAGNANFHLEPGLRFEGEAELASGESRVSVVGRAGEATDVAVDANIASLTDFLPDAAGAIDADFTARGTWPALAVNGTASASNLFYGGLRATDLDLRADVASIKPPSGELSIAATGVEAAGFAFDTLTVALDGDESAHTLALDAAGPQLSIDTRLSGALGASASAANAARTADAADAGTRPWRGRLDALTLTFGELPAFALDRPSNLAFEPEQFSISESCLASANAARVCVEAQRRAGSTELTYRMTDVPIAMIVAATAPDAPVRTDGLIIGNGRLVRATDGAWSGSATLGSARGNVAYPDSAEEPLIAYENFALEADLTPGRSQLTTRATLSDGGFVEGNATLVPSGDTQAITGAIALELGSLRFVELLTAEIANPRGTLAARYTIAGTLVAPELDGALTLEGFAAEIPAAGLELAEGRLRLAAAGNDLYELSGSVKSGEGTLTIGGTGGVANDSPFEATIAGTNVLAADIPGARVVASPDLRLTRDDGTLELRGTVTVPSADIDLSKLPGGGAPQASRDVVVIDAQATEEAGALPIDASINFALGDDVAITGYGLKGEVEGSLRVRERPGRATTGTGQIRVSGRYKAYGQDLVIERGRLLFATSPLDDPGLDIRAVRELREVKPGLLIRGTARNPVLTVFSDPPMEQAQALSYLVTGRPLNSLSNSDAETVDVARRALQTATGNLIAKSIGAKLGVDEIGVEDNAALGGTAFTVGKYLSPRLYLSYGMGVFEPGQVVTLRYQLTERFDIEAQSGTIENRAGVNYRIERD